MNKYLEYFKLHLASIVGLQKCPIGYIIMVLVVPPPVGPTYLLNEPHSQEQGSIEGEIRARLYFVHSVYQNDNAQVYQ